MTFLRIRFKAEIFPEWSRFMFLFRFFFFSFSFHSLNKSSATSAVAAECYGHNRTHSRLYLVTFNVSKWMPHSGVQLCKKRWILSTNNTEINQKFGSLERNKKMEDVWASQTEKTKKSKLSKPTYKATETKRCFGWRRGHLLVQSPLNVGWTTHHSAHQESRRG